MKSKTLHDCILDLHCKLTIHNLCSSLTRKYMECGPHEKNLKNNWIHEDGKDDPKRARTRPLSNVRSLTDWHHICDHWAREQVKVKVITIVYIYIFEVLNNTSIFICTTEVFFGNAGSTDHINLIRVVTAPDPSRTTSL